MKTLSDLSSNSAASTVSDSVTRPETKNKITKLESCVLLFQSMAIITNTSLFLKFFALEDVVECKTSSRTASTIESYQCLLFESKHFRFLVLFLVNSNSRFFKSTGLLGDILSNGPHLVSPVLPYF